MTANILIVCAVVMGRSSVWPAAHPCCGLKWHQSLSQWRQKTCTECLPTTLVICKAPAQQGSFPAGTPRLGTAFPKLLWQCMGTTFKPALC